MTRRKRNEDILERVIEVKKFETENDVSQARRRSKTFSEMREQTWVVVGGVGGVGGSSMVHRENIFVIILIITVCFKKFGRYNLVVLISFY